MPVNDPADHLGEHLAVFLFHGVIPDGMEWTVRNRTRKHLPRAAFIQTIERLRDRGTPVSMERAARMLAGLEPMPAGAFAVTFDDGFENNASLAAPILDGLGVPATFYLTSRFVDENAMSWIDRIEHCLETGGRTSLRLPWEDQARMVDSAESRLDMAAAVRAKVKSTPGLDPDLLADEIFAMFGMEPVRSLDGPLDLKMSWEQAKALAGHPGFLVGGHSHTHAILAFLSGQELEREVGLSLRLLREKAGIGPAHYSYPEGLAHCQTPAVEQCLKRHGVAVCPTAIAGLNPPGTDPFRIRRIMVL